MWALVRGNWQKGDSVAVAVGLFLAVTGFPGFGVAWCFIALASVGLRAAGVSAATPARVTMRRWLTVGRQHFGWWWLD